jgi:hypothetical protein
LLLLLLLLWFIFIIVFYDWLCLYIGCFWGCVAFTSVVLVSVSAGDEYVKLYFCSDIIGELGGLDILFWYCCRQCCGSLL